MGLQIRRVTQIKSKLLFASLAIMAIAVQPMYGFVASQVANAETTDGPAGIAEFTATSKCVAGYVAVDVTGVSKATSAQASATYSTIIGEELTGEWTNIPTGDKATGTLQSNESAANEGVVTFMVPLGVNTDDYLKYTADYDAIDCGPVFGKTTPGNNTTIVQSSERFEVSAEATSSLSAVESISWEMTGAKKIKSSDVFLKFKEVSDGKWAASYETVNIPTGDYTMTFTATDAASKKSTKTIKNISLVLDTDGPDISEPKLNTNTPKMMPADNGVSYDGKDVDNVNKKFTVTAKITDPNTVSVYNSKLMRLNTSGYTYDRVQSPVVTRDGDTWSFTIDTKSATDPVVDGMYQLFFNARDSLGNKSEQRINVRVDNTAPVVGLSTVKYDDKSVDVFAFIEDENLSHYWLSVWKDGQKYKIKGAHTTKKTDEFGSTRLLTLTEDGDYVVQLEAADKAGNKKGTKTEDGDSVKTVSFTVESKPVVTEPGNGDGDNTGGDKVSGSEGGNNSDIEKQDQINDGQIDDIRSPFDAPRTPGTNSIFNRNLAFNPTTDGDDETEDVLSANTFNQPAQTEVKGAADDKSSPASFFGLAWYWWILIVAALLAAIGWIAAAARKKQDA